MALNPGGLKRQKMCDETKPLANSRGFDHRSLFLLAPFNSFRMWKTRQSVWNWEKLESVRAEVPAGELNISANLWAKSARCKLSLSGVWIRRVSLTSDVCLRVIPQVLHAAADADNCGWSGIKKSGGEGGGRPVCVTLQLRIRARSLGLKLAPTGC